MSPLKEKLICFAAGIAVLVGTTDKVEAAAKGTCLVLADGYVSEYAWGKYREVEFHGGHPGYDYCMRGLLETASRFDRWLEGWDVRRIDLENHRGPLAFDGVDLVILDDVRQIVLDPHETAIIEFVRGGGGLLVYAGYWGLGGCQKNEYSVLPAVSSYQSTPLGAVLPVKILATPDLAMLRGKPKPSRVPVFLDKELRVGIETAEWEIFGFHVCQARGEVLAKLDGRPLICRQRLGQGRILVYAGDDLAWVRAGLRCSINRYSGTLWRRLAVLAVGETTAVPAKADPLPTWKKGPAFAHPGQPINFLWGGYFYPSTPEVERLWIRDLVTHSSTVFFLFPKTPEVLGKAGIAGWGEFGVPLVVKESKGDADTWAVNVAGKPMTGAPCYNNPKAMANMEKAMARRASELAKFSWIRYGHMGDETQFGNCYCEHCRKAFRMEYGYELPELENDLALSGRRSL